LAVLEAAGLLRASEPRSAATFRPRTLLSELKSLLETGKIMA
jgi:hypothetical protein